MAWDDTAPTEEEINGSSWDSKPPTPEELGEDDGVTIPKGVVDYAKTMAKNVIPDVEGIAKGAYQTFGPLLGSGPESVLPLPNGEEPPGIQAINQSAENLAHLPQGVIEEGKRIGAGELLTGHPINAVEKFGQAVEEKPVSTALDVLPIAEGAKAGLGALRESALSQVPGSFLDRASQNMALKDLGASPMQVRKIGPDVARQLGQKAMDEGIINKPTSYSMRNAATELENQAGETIGKIRKMADDKLTGETGPIYSNDAVVKMLQEQFGPEFESGVRSGESGEFTKALEEVSKAKPTFSGYADLATKLNKTATDAKALMKPNGAYADVARAISNFNDQAIKRAVPEMAGEYDKALQNYGATKKMGDFLLRKESREASGRIGPGGAIRHMTQSALDTFGYKMGAKVMNWMGKMLKGANGGEMPEAFKGLENIETPEGPEMAHGGIVSPMNEVNEFLESKFGNKKKMEEVK